MKPLVMLLALTGCAWVRNIPANSTPVREVRYLHTQDAQNFLGGMVADEALRLVFKGPHTCAVMEVGQPVRYRTCGNWSPIWRMGIVAGLAVTRRQLDRGYRESGALFNISGSWLWEMIRCAADSRCEHTPGPPSR